MSVGKREQILSRVFTILSDVPGFVGKFRNRAMQDNDARPSVTLLDGDEITTKPGTGRGRQRMSSVIATLKPQVFVVLKVAKVTNEDIGQSLNAFRGEIIQAIASDATLLALIGANGEISYDGCETDLKSGSTIEGQMRLDFSLSYPLNPYQN